MTWAPRLLFLVFAAGVVIRIIYLKAKYTIATQGTGSLEPRLILQMLAEIVIYCAIGYGWMTYWGLEG